MNDRTKKVDTRGKDRNKKGNQSDDSDKEESFDSLSTFSLQRVEQHGYIKIRRIWPKDS